MRVPIVLGASLLPCLVAARTHFVTVGGPNGGLFFVPQLIRADPNDTITFVFNPKNHTVTQSSLAQPCSPFSGGFDTGFNNPVVVGVAPQDRPTFNFTVQDTNPTWVYCRQGENTPASHCGQGMVFAINPGPRHSENSFKVFKQNALAVGRSLSGATPPPAPTPVTTVAATPSATSATGPTIPDNANLDTVSNLNSTDSDSSVANAIKTYAPAILGLLAGIFILLLGLLGVGIMMCIRRGARSGRSMQILNPSYAPVRGHVPPPTDDSYHEESFAPLKYSEQ